MTSQDGDPTKDTSTLSEKATFSDGELVADRYKVRRLVGRGSTGEVYEVIDQGLGGAVALKTLKHGVSKHPVLLERFRREIQNARRVTHPNVCRIFDMGIHKFGNHQRFFFTMELLEGESLAGYLAGRPPLTTDEALPILTQVAAGLQAAHDSGIVHRDLKPGNIMLLPASDGGAPRAVITDFGLAISAEQISLGLTESSELIGTPEYMAPEQIDPASTTPATDVYALGIIAYELLTKRRPFDDAETPIATVLQRRRVPPRSLLEFLPSIDPSWERAIVAGCLALKPEQRFQRPMELVNSLGASVLPAAPQPAPSDGWWGRAWRKLRGRRPRER